MMTPQQLVAEARLQIREVDLGSAARMLNEGVLCLDVREAGEHGGERLPGAINIPRGVLEFRISEVPAFADKQKPLLVYCKTGGRAALAVLNLQRMGYSGALCIAGGIESWRSQGLPLTRDDTLYGG